MKHDYIITHSGQQVSRDAGVPTIGDIAVALSRLPRFGGHGRRWWSVLDHSLFVEDLAHGMTVWSEDRRSAAGLRLHALLHDAHEALTGDIPTPFKSVGMKATQHAVDMRLYAALVPEDADMLLHDVDEIKALDRRALLAEAMTVGPPTLKTSADVVRHFNAAPYENDVNLLARGMGQGLWGSYVWPQNDYGVQRFVEKYNLLRIEMFATEPTPLERTTNILRSMGAVEPLDGEGKLPQMVAQQRERIRNGASA